jgi:hypothetical protein
MHVASADLNGASVSRLSFHGWNSVALNASVIAHVDLLGFAGLGFVIEAIDNAWCKSHSDANEI